MREFKEILKSVKVIHLGLSIKDGMLRDSYVILIQDQKFDYFQGIGHRKAVRKDGRLSTILTSNLKINEHNLLILEKESKIKPVDPKDVICCLLGDMTDENFKDWCGNYGYDTDSIKADYIYKACLENTEKMEKLFTSEELEMMREQLEDY